MSAPRKLLRPRWIPNPQKLPRWVRWGPACILLICAVVLAALGWARVLSARTLLASLPRDTTVYLELSSAERAAEALVGMGFVDGAAQGEPGDALVRAVAAALQVQAKDVRAFAESLDAAALAARPNATEPDEALVLRLDRAKPVETLLESSGRFVPDGAVPGGRIYALRARQVAPDRAQPALLVERALSQIELDGARRAVAWFPGDKLLVVGARSMIEDVARVVDGAAASLLEAPGHARLAKKLDRDRAVVGLLDGALGPTELLDGTPLGVQIDFGRAGMLLEVQGAAAKGIQKSEALAEADLDLVRSLPAETLAYVASSRGGAVSSLAADLAEDQLAGLDRGRRGDTGTRRVAALRAEIAALVGPQDLEDGALGGLFAQPGVSALVMVPEYRHDPLEGVAALSRRFALVHLVRLTDPGQGEQIRATVRRAVSEGELASRFVTRDDAAGLVAEPAPGVELPTVRLAERAGAMLIAVGAPALIERSVAAFAGGTATLGQDPAHRRALEATAGEHELLAWLDGGRLATVLLAADDSLRAALEDAGVPIGAVRLTGADRLTVAFAMGCSPDECRLTALNLPAALPLGASAARLFQPWLAQRDAALLAGRVGLVECDLLLDRMQACAPAVAETMRADVQAAIDASRLAWPELAAGDASGQLAGACRTAIDILGPGAGCPGQPGVR